MALRLGFIGVGGVAQGHLNNIAERRDADVAAVCDIDKARVAQAVEKFGATGYRDYREMLKNEKLDGVYVCLIPSAHGRIEPDLVAAKMPFFVEKPIHIDLAQAKKIARAVAKAKLLTCVGYHWRYQEPTRLAKTFVNDRPLSVVRGRWMGGMPGVWWWRRKQQSGGQLVEQTTHIVDLARFFAGDVDRVWAVGATGLMKDFPKYNVEDSSTVAMRFKSGAVGTIVSACCAGTAGYGRTGLDLLGRDFAVELTGGEVTTFEKGQRTAVSKPSKWSHPFGYEDEAFVKALQGDRSLIRSDYADGVRTLAVTLAANESMRTGKPVKC